MTPFFILALIGILDQCEAPAVSLSFSSKSKSGANVSSVFAFKNGSWVAVNNSLQVSKGLGNVSDKLNKDNKNGELKASLTNDVEDLFRKINRTIPLKLLPAQLTEAPGFVTKSLKISKVVSTEKSLGDLFLEWLSKQEAAKPVKAMSASTVPVLGLQIDFDDSKSQKPVTNREVAQSKVSLREGLRKTISQPTESVRSHVNKREPQRFYTEVLSEQEEHDRPNLDLVKHSTPSSETEEFHSGQLLVHNELNTEKKHKVNDLPKYVMKFLSQCKALIEENYDDEVGQEAKDNYEDDDSLLNEGSNGKFRNKQCKKNCENNSTDTKMVSEQEFTHSTFVEDGFNDDDEFESLTIHKKPKGKIAKIEIDKTNPSTKPYQNEADDSYDDAFDQEIQDWKVEQNLDAPPSNESMGKVTKQAYFSSQTNVSCRPVLEEFTPEKETYTADCSTLNSDFTTLSPMQWKVLMDFLKERMPSSCSTKSTCTAASCTMSCSRSTCTKTACTKTACTKTTTTQTTSTTTASTKSACSSCSKCTAVTPKGETKVTKESRSSCAGRCGITTVGKTNSSASAKDVTTRSGVSSSSRTSPRPRLDSDDGLIGSADINNKQSNAITGKPPERYLIKIETTKPKRFHESVMQGRKPSNWFENIRNLKLLEGLKSPSPNTMKSVYYNLRSSLHESPIQTMTNNENDDSTEKMIAEGVIPLKTGSTLNLYISYVLNKTKARRNKLPIVNHEHYSSLNPTQVTQGSRDDIDDT